MPFPRISAWWRGDGDRNPDCRHDLDEQARQPESPKEGKIQGDAQHRPGHQNRKHSRRQDRPMLLGV